MPLVYYVLSLLPLVWVVCILDTERHCSFSMEIYCSSIYCVVLGAWKFMFSFISLAQRVCS